MTSRKRSNTAASSAGSVPVSHSSATFSQPPTMRCRKRSSAAPKPNADGGAGKPVASPGAFWMRTCISRALSIQAPRASGPSCERIAR